MKKKEDKTNTTKYGKGLGRRETEMESLIGVNFRLTHQIEKKWMRVDGKVQSISMNMPGKEFVPSDYKEFWGVLRENFILWDDENNRGNGIIEPVEMDSVEKILEIGYGSGAMGKKFIEMGKEYVGIDYYRMDGLDTDHFKTIDKNGIPLLYRKKKYYDLVFCDNLFQAIPKQYRSQYFAQAAQVLNENNHGGLVFSTMLLSNLNKGDFELRDGKPYSYFFNTVYELDTEIGMKKELRQLGFKTIYVFYPLGEKRVWAYVYALK